MIVVWHRVSLSLTTDVPIPDICSFSMYFQKVELIVSRITNSSRTFSLWRRSSLSYPKLASDDPRKLKSMMMTLKSFILLYCTLIVGVRSFVFEHPMHCKRQTRQLEMVTRDEYMQPHFKVIPTTMTKDGVIGSKASPSSDSASRRSRNSSTSKTSKSDSTRTENRSRSSGNFHYHDEDEIDVGEYSTTSTSDLLQRYRSLAEYESHWGRKGKWNPR